MMQVEVHFEKGSVGKIHSHSNIQLTYVLGGKFEFIVGEETKIVNCGDSLYLLPDAHKVYSDAKDDPVKVCFNSEDYQKYLLK